MAAQKSSTTASSRIKKELAECAKDDVLNTCGLSIRLTDDSNLHSLDASLCGPPETPFAGGTFKLKINIPNNYPFVPPKIHFETKIWHPNISSQTGVICLDILKDQWAAAMTLRTALLSVQALLSAPEPDDPQDAVVAQQYKESREEYNQTARYWTEIYAKGGDSEDAKVEQLKEMGFGETKCREALAACNGDIERSIEYLFNSA
eukprot:Nk52_evm17s159 gene=Nk52_evmTU17s159